LVNKKIIDLPDVTRPLFRSQYFCEKEALPMTDLDLTHILWIGGSPCSGKSTISHAIAQIYVFIDYHLDAWSSNHFARRIAAGDAAASAFLNMSMNQRWIERPVEALVQEAVTTWSKHFYQVIEDLQSLPKENCIIAEGNFFPECVAPYLSSPHQAIWLVPTDDFCEQGRRRKWDELARRQKMHGIYDEGSDPEQRRRNVIARDCQLARYVKQQAESLHLPIFEVDGNHSREEMVELVERHFAPYLTERFKRRK
jgi:adenylate kinase family enzyme